LILYDNDFLYPEDIQYIIDLTNNLTLSKTRSDNLHYDGLDFLNSQFDLSPIKNNIFKKSNFTSIRFQKYDESINQVTRFHGHFDIHNYLIFLNDDFEGGELEFDCGVLIKPKKGSIVYFNNNEHHRVRNCIGDRYTLVLSGNTKMEYMYSIKKPKNLL